MRINSRGRYCNGEWADVAGYVYGRLQQMSLQHKTPSVFEAIGPIFLCGAYQITNMGFLRVMKGLEVVFSLVLSRQHFTLDTEMTLQGQTHEMCFCGGIGREIA